VCLVREIWFAKEGIERKDLMSPKTIFLLAVLVVCAYPAAASTYYVGSCKSGSFPTISAAVKAAPAGSTILICAGNYSEQVIISKDLTLNGIASSTGVGAFIVAPTSMQTTTSPIDALNKYFGLIAPVIWVTGGNVNIQNVLVSVLGHAPCPPRTVAFYYATGASGTLNHVASFGDACSVGIWAENASFTPAAVTIENSTSNQGIVAGSLLLQNGTLTVTIKNNQVFPIAPEGIYGIYLYSVSGTVETNFVSGPRWSSNESGPSGLSGFAIFDDGVAQTDVTISGNTIQVNESSETQDFFYWGIAVNVDGATVKSNKISGAHYAIGLYCNAATVSGNTISNADYGIMELPAGFTPGVNTFYNTGIKTLSCP
jgi:hypothetical protein